MLSNYYISKEISSSNMSQIVASISRSYEVVENIKSEFPILSGPMLSNSVSILKQTLVQHELIRMIEKGFIEGVNYKVSNNKQSNYPFLEIYNSSFIVTLSHVQVESQLPRKAIYRNERAANNQLSIFSEDNADPSRLYFILTHGHNGVRPDFICLGLPDENNEFWRERINLLDRKILVPSKQEEEESLVTLTQYAKEVLKIEENNK